MTAKDGKGLTIMGSRIGYKLIVCVGLLIIPAFAVFSYVLIQAQIDEHTFQIKQHTDQLSEMVKSSTKYDMLLKNRERVHRVIDTIAGQPDVEKVRIFNKEGKIIFSSDKNEMGSMVDQRAEACHACHAAGRALEKLPIAERARIFTGKDGARNMGIINPIYNEPGCYTAACHAHSPGQSVLGVLDFTVSLAGIDKQISEYRSRVILFAVLFIALVSAALWVLMQQMVAKPVARLARATKIVAQGDLSHQIEVTGNDELSDLANSFNRMIEKLTEAQRKLYQQDKLASIGRLAAGVAHEINNPLTGVLSYSSYVLKRLNDNAPFKEELDIIVRETKRCSEIIKGLLDFARQRPPQKTASDINALIGQSLKIVDNQLTSGEITVIRNFAENLPNIPVDANQVQQVMINLFVNAADAMNSAGGRLTVSTALRDDRGVKSVRITVSDTGCGMTREQLSKLFEPFYTTKGAKGTGLGLSVVWGIIQEHHGTILAASEPGRGTTFTIDLPVEPVMIKA